MSKLRYLHIGYPKCASTSLQYDFFNAHPQIHHLGWGMRNQTGWRDDELAVCGEVDIRYKPEFHYDRAKVRGVFERHFELVERQPATKAVGVSFEAFCFTMVFDVEPLTKARRLHDIFGDGTKILIVLREPFALLRSFYFEMVRDGFAGTFEDFVRFQYLYQFRSLLFDLRYFDIYGIYAELFGADNICVIPLELLKQDTAKFLRRISDHLEVDALDLALGQYNSSNDMRVLELLRRLNARYRHNMGNGYFCMTDGEKLDAYWRTEFGVTMPDSGQLNYNRRYELVWAAEEAILTNGETRTVLPDLHGVVDDLPRLAETAKAMARGEMSEIDASYDDFWQERLSAFWADSNRALAALTGYDLAALGYPV
jgi:hypothetical protein